MKLAIFALTANAASIVCVGVAGWCAINKVDGWGWFLFGALVLSTSVRSTTSKDDDEDEEEG